MWAYSYQNRQYRYFLVTICPNGVCPLNIFYRIWHGEGLPGFHPHAKFFCCGFKNVGLEPPKSQKLVIFGIYLAKRGISPSAIFTKFGVAEGLPGPHGRANFHHCDFKNVPLRPPKSLRNRHFWYKFGPNKKVHRET